jgi:hypothetical protein
MKKAAREVEAHERPTTGEVTPMMLQVSTTDRRDGKALALFARCAEWQQGHTRDGRPFFAIPGSETGLLHMTDQRECSCPDFQRARNVCKHVRAVRLWMAAFATGAVSPKREASADLADELVILTPEGAAFLVEQHDRTVYATLHPTCRVAGCDSDPEPHSQDCYRHQLVDAF